MSEPHDVPPSSPPRSPAAIWSLLEEPERAGLAQCAIFRGDFSLADAEHILVLPEEAAADEVIQALIQRALVQPVGRPSDIQQRFRLEEGMRKFAGEKLAEDERDAATLRLVVWYAERAEHHARGLHSPRIGEHLEAMRLELANMRFALQHATRTAPEHAAKLAWGLWHFVELTALQDDALGQELCAQVEAALDHTGPETAPQAKSRLLLVVARLCASRAETSQSARTLAEEAAELARAHKLWEAFGEAKRCLAHVAMAQGQLDAADRHLQQARQTLDREHDDRLTGMLHADLGELSLRYDDFEEVYAHYRHALALFRRCEDVFLESVVLEKLGRLEWTRRRFEQASAFFGQAVELCEAWGDTKRRDTLESMVERCRAALDTDASASATPSPEPSPRLLVAEHTADWFVWKQAYVDLSRRDAPRRILTRLVEHRLAEPGSALPKDVLVEAGWPQEVLHPDAAASRIYTAIRQLRNFGLRDAIISRDGGYLIDAEIEVVRSKQPDDEVLDEC